MTRKAKQILLLLVGLASLASAQTLPGMHNVLLTWNDVICSTTVTTNCNAAGTSYNVYKAPGVCPAAGTLPSANPLPFSQLANNIDVATSTGPIVLSYTDVNALSAGQTWCYYVTAFNNTPGLYTSPESGPSNYATAFLAAPQPAPAAPTGTKATVQ